MALSARLQQKQSQSLVMTPQLLQSIRLLQFGNLELAAFIAREVEKNPLLEVAEDGPEAGDDRDAGPAEAHSGVQKFPIDDRLETTTAAIEERMGSSTENVFEADTPPITSGSREAPAQDPWIPRTGAVSLDEETSSLEAYCAAPSTLRGHLLSQLPMTFREPGDAMIAAEIIESIDEDGYLRREIVEIATALGVGDDRVEAVLSRIQAFDPPGVGGRDLAECLAIQLRDKNRFDPAIEAMLANLGLLARRDYQGLSRICGVSIEDILEMAAEIRALDPRPGRCFASDPMQVAVPDIFVRPGADGGWSVELNSEALPRLLVDREYYARVSRNCRNETEKTFMVDCLHSANWLIKSIDQRAQTVLKVAAEIVKCQDMFLVGGVEYLKPLNLRMVADAIGMHESTVSRVTANKYMMTPRGLYELKYFFTAPIPSVGGNDQHSAESVRHRIRQLVDAETAENILSDDTIVKQLREQGVDIARRTVAKYRESMSIPSSVQRRREKLALNSRKAS